jgi:glycerol kinase
MIFDGELNQLSYSYEEYGLITPREGWVEQDAELWWELLLKTARDAIEKAGVS